MKNKVLDMVNDIPLNRKFFFIYVLCVLIPIVTTNIFFLNTVEHHVKDRENENLTISINRATTEIEDILQAGMDISQSISMDRFLYELLDEDYVNDKEYYSTFYTFMRDRVSLYTTVNRDIQNIEIYTSNQRIINGGNYFYIDAGVREKEWYKKFDQMEGDMLVYSYKQLDPKRPKSIMSSISIFKKLNTYVVYSENKNIVKLDINMNGLYDIINREKNYMDLILVDDLGRVICSTNKRYEGDIDAYRNFETLSFGKNQGLVTNAFEYHLLEGWKLVGVLDEGTVNKEINAARRYILVLMLITTVVSSFLVIILLRSYNYRVMGLTKHMRRIKEQQFDHIKPFEIREGKDEIGELIRSFNLMAQKINSLIHDVYKLELQKKDLHLERVQAELDFLQSQMNPHFLFNTLNAILIVCVKNNYTNVVDIIKYLAKILRRLLSWKDDMVSIKEEIDFTEMYLKIEKFRFGEQFAYQFFVDDETLEYKIPKMSIQTIVENACKHGLQAVKGDRVVSITIDRNENALEISIKDNGQGIEANKQNELINQMKSNHGTVNIGIRNVYRRLKLNYGEDVEFHLNSKINEGTEISFQIPIKVLTQEQVGDEFV